MFAAAWVFYSVPVLLVLKTVSRRVPDRRRFLRTAAAGALAAPAVIAAAAYIRRTDLHFREFDIPVPGLPKDLQGLRIVQISDIHLGPVRERGLAVARHRDGQ